MVKNNTRFFKSYYQFAKILSRSLMYILMQDLDRFLVNSWLIFGKTFQESCVEIPQDLIKILYKILQDHILTRIGIRF